MEAVIAVKDAASRDDISMVLKMCLPELKLIFVNNGSHCLQTVGSSNPDLIILDNSFDDINERNIISGIRNLSVAPILVLSWVMDERDMLKVIDAGADAYVTKPVKQLEFVAHVKALLRISKQIYRPHREI